jgi:hypothetical protein
MKKTKNINKLAGVDLRASVETKSNISTIQSVQMNRLNVTDVIHILAGIMVLFGTIGVYTISDWFLLVHIMVGLNLIQFGFTRFCPAQCLLKHWFK